MTQRTRPSFVHSGVYHLETLSKVRIKENEQCEGLQELLGSLKSTVPENSFIQASSRGGLVTLGDNLMGIVKEAEICFRKTVDDRELVF